jgi:putative membrane-bound dehydrogenase-like protein
MSKALVALLATIGLTAVAFRQAELAPADKLEEFPRVPATEPRDVAQTFRTLHGFRMDLLAAEPLVTDPVALEYDENGRAWVVEMRDYPYTDKSTDRPNVERTTDAPLGRIRILDDTDGDGLFDKSSLFAEDLSWPTGLALWKGGCYVTATPDVLYLKDTDGDGRADERRRVFTGFKKLNVQAVINNPRWGLDHKLYCAGASNGGEITKPGDASFKPVRFGRADFAFDPNTEEFEVLTGGARFGQAFDDYGNRFLCNIRNPVQHVVFENRYLARNPYLVVTNAVHDCAEAGDTLPVYRASPPEPWRAARADRWRLEAGQTYPRSELAGEGYFTSACGITIYRGSAYPKEFYGNVFLGEVAGNLIHRETLTPDGVTFRAARADANAEFVASTDNWFRPVNFTNAPDGTLHVCDMYRETIEHPWSIPDDMKGKLDLESGRDRGRIYRLAPLGFVTPKGKPNLGRATTAELVRALEHPDGWWRDTAHRLIFERQDKAAVEPLRKLLWEGKTDFARLLALTSLKGLGAIDQEDLLKALHDESPQVNVWGVRFAEGEWKKMPIVLRRVGNMIYAAKAKSRFQIALSLGTVSDPAAHSALNAVARVAANDPWISTALLSSSVGRADKIILATGLDRPTALRMLADGSYERVQFDEDPAGYGDDIHVDLLRQLAFQVGAEGKPEAIQRLLEKLIAANDPTRKVKVVDSVFGQTQPQTAALGKNDSAALAGLIAGISQGGRKLSQFTKDDRSQAAMAKFLSEAATVVADRKASLAARISAGQLLAHGRFAEVRAVLERVLDPREDVELQRSAIHSLAGYSDAAVPQSLLKNYKTLTPTIRTEIVDVLASSTARQPALLDAIEAKQVAAADVPLARRALLMKSKDPTVAARAAKLLMQSVGKRADVVAKYKPALQVTGVAERGHKVFIRECKTCHRLHDEGFEVGPNLATILHRSPDELLTHILDPNREVSPNYLEYAVGLNDGRTLTGLIAEETAAGLTLRKAENVQQSILRSEIDEILSTGKSLMPEGLEQKLTPQDMADLLAFLLRRR